MLRTDLGKTLGKNFLGKGLIKLVYKFIKLVTKTNSKVCKPMIYDKAINDLIPKNR